MKKRSAVTPAMTWKQTASYMMKTQKYASASKTMKLSMKDKLENIAAKIVTFCIMMYIGPIILKETLRAIRR